MDTKCCKTQGIWTWRKIHGERKCHRGCRNSKMLVVKTSKISGTATDDVTLFFGRHETIISSMSSGQQPKHFFFLQKLGISWTGWRTCSESKTSTIIKKLVALGMWVKHPENCQVEAGAKVWRQARENLRFKSFSAGKKQEINVQQIGFNLPTNRFYLQTKGFGAVWVPYSWPDFYMFLRAIYVLFCLWGTIRTSNKIYCLYLQCKNMFHMGRP